MNGRWRKCFCAAEELAGCSERELQLMAEELHKRNRLLTGRGQVEITQKQLANFRRENAAQEVLLRQQRHDRETRAALQVLEGRGGEPITAGASLLPTVSDAQTQGNQSEPATLSSQRVTGDGDTLRVLRRLR